ncbi:MAG: hypothetical protein QW727_04520 [Candidatus Pacearchaeota archaeon]
MIEKRSDIPLRYLIKIKNKTSLGGLCKIEYILKEKDTNNILFKLEEFREFSGNELLVFQKNLGINYLGGKDIIPSFKFSVGKEFILERDYIDFFRIIQVGYNALVNKIQYPTFAGYNALVNKIQYPTFAGYNALVNKIQYPTFAGYNALVNKTA